MMLSSCETRNAGAGPLDRTNREWFLGDCGCDDVSLPWVGAVCWQDQETEYPNIELRETDSDYVLRAEVPGLRREDVDVEVAADHLILRGHPEGEHEEEGACVCGERSSERFERSVALPGEIRVDDVKASMKDGVMTVHLPKMKETTTRRIEVTEH